MQSVFHGARRLHLSPFGESFGVSLSGNRPDQKITGACPRGTSTLRVWTRQQKKIEALPVRPSSGDEEEGGTAAEVTADVLNEFKSLASFAAAGAANIVVCVCVCVARPSRPDVRAHAHTCLNTSRRRQRSAPCKKAAGYDGDRRIKHA